MTEIKPLLEANSPTAVTSQSAQQAEFTIGNNKLRYFGKPDIMAKHSDLIKSNLEIYANSTSPYPLATFAIVLDKPMTILWRDMNEFSPLGSHQYTLSFLEWLHMYRLMAYFGMDLKKYPTVNMLKDFTESKEEEKKTISDVKNKETLIRILDSAFKDRLFYDRKLSNNLFKKLIKDYPDIAKQINYIPVYIDKKYATYADRKTVGNTEIFEKSNPEWLASRIINTTLYAKNIRSHRVSLIPLRWGPDKITFSTSTAVLGLNPGPPPKVTDMLNPIII